MSFVNYFNRLQIFTILISASNNCLAANSNGSGTYNCTMSNQSMAYGNYNPLNYTAATTTATITVTCTASSATANVSYTVTASPGNSGNESARYMLSGSNKLSHNVYVSGSYSLVFGQSYIIQVNYTLTQASPSRTDVHTMYGKVPSAPTTIPGMYSDALTLTY